MLDTEHVIIESGAARQPFNYAVGLHGSLFLQELRDNRRFMAVKCPMCKKVYIPPRRVCGACFVEMDKFVEVGPKGSIGTFTILRYAFIDPETGEKKPVPYGYGFIRLDGADTLFQHYIDIQDESKVKIGARVEPVFADERKGTIKDIRYFRIID
ncbi:MAG: OB-fold domain-containing protein [Desulfosarcina sp.]|nr:OB-fold domain-containing protein [Desulfosarcina sp.]